MNSSSQMPQRSHTRETADAESHNLPECEPENRKHQGSPQGQESHPCMTRCWTRLRAKDAHSWGSRHFRKFPTPSGLHGKDQKKISPGTSSVQCSCSTSRALSFARPAGLSSFWGLPWSWPSS